jgi:hypothetical protein
MPFASSNLAQVRYAPEATFGTIPAATVGTRALRITGESLAFALTTDSSKELRSDRQVTDLVLTGASASGGINIEASYGEYDTLLEAALMGTWAPIGASSSTFSGTWTAGGTTITAGSATSGNDIFTALHQGQSIRIVAPGNVCDGQVVKVHPRLRQPVRSSRLTPRRQCSQLVQAWSTVQSIRLASVTSASRAHGQPVGFRLPPASRRRALTPSPTSWLASGFAFMPQVMVPVDHWFRLLLQPVRSSRWTVILR